MKTVPIRYAVTFGKGDGTSWMHWEIDLTDEESAAYDNAVANNIPLDEVSELEDALMCGCEEIEREETSMGIDNGDEYCEECQGLTMVDPDELNCLVAERDPRALELLGLTDADEDELEKWDAYEVDDLPYVKDLYEDFEPSSPFDEGWSLSVEFVDPNE